MPIAYSNVRSKKTKKKAGEQIIKIFFYFMYLNYYVNTLQVLHNSLLVPRNQSIIRSFEVFFLRLFWYISQFMDIARLVVDALSH